MRLNLFLLFFIVLNFACNTRKDIKSKEYAIAPIATNLKSTTKDPINLKSNANKPVEPKEDFPNELSPFIVSGFELYGYHKGDLNKDGLSDYILILEDKEENSYNMEDEGEDEENDEYTPPERELRVDLIIRQRNNSLKHHSSNYYLLASKEWNSYHEDSIRLAPTNDGFITTYNINGYGPTSIYSKLEFHFKYTKKGDNWYLVKTVDKTGYNSPSAALGVKMDQAKEANPGFTQAQVDSLEAVYKKTYNDKEGIIIETPKDFGIIPFSKFKKGHYLQ